MEQRFWTHVEKTETCWLWTGAVQNSGYAMVRVPGRKMRVAHRIAYQMCVGPIPDGSVIDHKCRVRHCVNPDHLQAVSPRENAENIDVTPENNKTGHLNVYKRNNAFGYVVIVRSRGERHYGGSHRTLEEAAAAARDLRNRVKTNNLQDRLDQAA